MPPRDFLVILAAPHCHTVSVSASASAALCHIFDTFASTSLVSLLLRTPMRMRMRLTCSLGSSRRGQHQCPWIYTPDAHYCHKDACCEVTRPSFSNIPTGGLRHLLPLAQRPSQARSGSTGTLGYATSQWHIANMAIGDQCGNWCVPSVIPPRVVLQHREGDTGTCRHREVHSIKEMI